MEPIITAATVLTMYFAAINSNDVNAMYSSDQEDVFVNKTEVYECHANHQMAQKEQKMEYCYEYDEQGRLVNKEMLCWDEAKKEWTKNCRLTYKYYKHGYNIEVNHWNSKKQVYDLPTEVILFRSQAPNLTKVKTYKMNEKMDNMYLSSSMLLMEPLGIHLPTANK